MEKLQLREDTIFQQKFKTLNILAEMLEINLKCHKRFI